MENKLDLTLDSVVSKLAQNGWTLPAEIGIYAINIIGETEDIDDIDQFLFELFSRNDYAVAKRMINEILDSKIREGLKPLVNQCWEAFQNNSYAICANSLIVVIEGILSEFSEDKTLVKMKNICQKYINEFPEGGSPIEKHIWISVNLFIKNLYRKSNFSKEEPTQINRHWLLHGRSDFDVEEIDCLRLFNAVQSLSMIVNKKAKEDVANG